MGAKAGVAVGVVTALLGIGGAAVSVRATRATPQPSRRGAVVRTDEGETLASGPSPDAGSAPPVVDRAPEWGDAFQHLVVATRSAPSAAAPAGVADRGADTVLLARVRAVPGVREAQLVAPGTVAVVTSGRVGDVAAVPGIVGVDRDTPMAVLAADPNESGQWQWANNGDRANDGGWAAVLGADAGSARAWSVTSGAGVVVAVIDAGTDLDHPDLAGRTWTNPADPCGNGIDDDRDGFVDDCRGWDFGSNDNDPRPEPNLAVSNHGTHVAGLVAAGRNGVGGVGAAPEAAVMALKVSSGEGISLAKVSAAIRYAADHGAKVINVSLATAPGTARTSVATLEAAVGYARGLGVVIVAGAGNNGVDISDGLLFPAGLARWYDNVIAVGATTGSDRRANFSNFGLPAPLEIYAPGSWLSSTLPGGTWGRMSGTSMAAPVVAGTVALVLASGRAVAPAAVRDLLAASADAFPFGPRVNAAVAVGLERVVPAPPTTTTVAPTTTTVAPTTTTRAPTSAVPRSTTTTRPPTTTTVARPTTTTRPPPATTRPTVAPTSTSGPLVTTPVPPPVVSGAWKLTALSTRSGPLAGGNAVRATGVFPVGPKVQVWFSGLGPVVDATVAADGTSLTFVTPPMSVRSVTEVTVRFTAAGRTVSLSMPNAFTFAPNG